MNVIHELLQSPLVGRLGLTLLHSLWQGLAAAGLLKIVLMANRDCAASARYLAACFTLLLIPIVCVYTFCITHVPHHAPTEVAITIAAPTPQEFQPSESNRSDSPIDPSFSGDSFQARQSANAPGRAPAVTAKTPEGSTRANVEHRALAWLTIILPWLVLIWALGVFCMSFWNFGGWLAVQQLRYLNTHPASGDSIATFQKLTARLGLSRPIRLMQSRLARTPLVVGVFRPMILVPAAVLTDLPIAELESILAHELAHVLRHDYLVNLLQSIIETLLFYHPAVWWISRQIRMEREHCCDDMAIRLTRDRATYVRALAAVASVRVPAFAPAAAGGKLLPRLRRILAAPEIEARRTPRWVAGIVVAICLGAILATRFQPAVMAQNENPSTKPSKADNDLAYVHGSVLDPKGQPVAGAPVVVAPVWPDSAGEDLPQTIARTHSGADGRFSVSFRKSAASMFIYRGGASGRDLWKKTRIIASAPNFGLAWSQFDHVDANGELVLQLVDDLPIEGRVIDLEGQPVSGVKVHVSGVVNHILAKWTGNDSDYKTPPPDYSSLSDPRALTDDNGAIVSDVNGRFHITGMGRERLVGLDSESSKVSFVGVNVLTRDMRAVTRAFFGPDQNKTAYFGNKFEIAAAPAISISGTVRDDVTHLPLAGVQIETGSSHGRALAITDAQGNYRLDGLMKVPRVPITIDAICDNRPYIPELRREVPPAAPDNSIAFDIGMHKGVWISGKVTDARTHEPLPAIVEYWPSATNQAAFAVAEFQELVFSPAYCQTRADGSYRLAVLPQRGLIAVSTASEQFRKGVGADKLQDKRANGNPNTLNPIFRMDLYNSVREVNIPPDGSTERFDFELEQSGPAKGKPATEEATHGRTRP